jgi:hypothetical protein
MNFGRYRTNKIFHELTEVNPSPIQPTHLMKRKYYATTQPAAPIDWPTGRAVESGHSHAIQQKITGAGLITHPYSRVPRVSPEKQTRRAS